MTADGTGFKDTVVGAEVAVQLPLLVCTVYEPGFSTVILWVVAPFDHK